MELTQPRSHIQVSQQPVTWICQVNSLESPATGSKLIWEAGNEIEKTHAQTFLRPFGGSPSYEKQVLEIPVLYYN